MSTEQEQRVVRLETPVECGHPDCHEKTQDTFYESTAHSKYTYIELVPFCAKHRSVISKWWQHRFY